MSKPKKISCKFQNVLKQRPIKKSSNMKLLSAKNGVMISVNTGVPIKEMDKLNLHKIWGISSSCCMFLSVHET